MSRSCAFLDGPQPTPETPEREAYTCTRALWRWLTGWKLIDANTPLVDPCAGDGAILRALRSEGHAGHQVAIELRAECAAPLAALEGNHSIHCAADALDRANETVRPWPDEVVVTNPPFSLAQPFVERWTAGPLAAFLLPYGFLGSGTRAAWWPRHRPAHLLTLTDRPAFVAVCKGIAKTKIRAQVKGCGRSYPLGTKGRCECGGTIGDGTDSCTYAWFVWTRIASGAPAFDWLRRTP